MAQARWEKAEALRDELERFKRQRRDQELEYLASAVALNQSVFDERGGPTLAKRRAREEAANEAAEVRRQRDEVSAATPPPMRHQCASHVLAILHGGCETVHDGDHTEMLHALGGSLGYSTAHLVQKA